MDNCSENTIKTLCCTCLSHERKLFQLCRLADGVNNLYSLLSYDAEAYKEVFYKDAASLHVCWECRAVLARITAFRNQACSVQKQLTDIADGRKIVHQSVCLSTLKSTMKNSYDLVVSHLDGLDNFIDCGPASDDDDDDVPLSELHANSVSDDGNVEKKAPTAAKVKKKKKMKSSENGLSSFRYEKYFTTTQMTYKETLDYRDGLKKDLEASHKCDSCVEVFKSEIALQKHIEDFHTEKENYTLCSICKCYIPENILEYHESSHFTLYTCKICGQTERSINEATNHMKERHRRKDIKGIKRIQMSSPGFKTRKKASNTEKGTPFRCVCPECSKCFETKSKRWKHIQRYHREGYACDKCGKKFAFRNNLNRHVRLHQSPPPRELCQVCHKLIRCDLMKIHARVHASRESCTCRACNKTFVSRASYEHHLKYTRAHAQGDILNPSLICCDLMKIHARVHASRESCTCRACNKTFVSQASYEHHLKYTRAHAQRDILKHKCSECDKGYRSRGELRDHMNYQHMGKTQHKCPECGKALATRRCITRHVRRAHRGVKENARDKICQQCGKAFRDKKGLREHEFIHTGERPLSCEICGCTFRQSASLYTHKKRVHKIYPKRKNVELVDTSDV